MVLTLKSGARNLEETINYRLFRSPSDLSALVKSVDLDEFLHMRALRLEHETYWPNHKRCLRDLYRILIEGSRRKYSHLTNHQLHYATSALEKVTRYCLKPVRARKSSRRTEGLIDAGPAWQVYLFDGITPLELGDQVIITSIEEGEYLLDRVRDTSLDFEISKIKMPRGGFGTNYHRDIEIVMNIDEMKDLFGYYDAEGKKIKIEKGRNVARQPNWFLFEVKRIGAGRPKYYRISDDITEYPPEEQLIETV